MLHTALALVATSYIAWYMEQYETRVVYPFDSSYTSPVAAGEPRLAETRLAASDGEELIVWRRDADAGKPTVVYFPGNAGALADRVDRFSVLLDRGYGLVALGYRGSSGSGGTPSEALIITDAMQLIEAEVAHPLVLFGESLGTAVAIRMAAKGHGDALILEAPFTSFTELIESQFPNEQLAHLVTQTWDNDVAVPNVAQPLLVIHGASDQVVPIGMGRRIFERAGSDQKQFLEVALQGHTGDWSAPVQKAIFDFLEGY